MDLSFLSSTLASFSFIFQQKSCFRINKGKKVTYFWFKTRNYTIFNYLHSKSRIRSQFYAISIENSGVKFTINDEAILMLWNAYMMTVN